MKKSFFFLLLIFVAAASPVFAEEWDDSLKESIEGLDTVQASRAPIPEYDTLVNQEAVAARQSVAEVDRRVSDLERSHRFLEDRVRLLQRNVDDLKRRR